MNRFRLSPFLLLLVASYGFAQQAGPTLEETGSFLVGKLDNQGIFSRGIDKFGDGSQTDMRTWITQSFSINGCTGSYLIHLRSQEWSETAWHDGQNNDYDKGSFDAKTFLMASAKIMRFYPDENADPPVYEIGIPGKKGLRVITPDNSLAERLLKAFNGLAELCGAKKEAY